MTCKNTGICCKGHRAAICAAGVSTTAKIVALELMTYANPKQASLTCKQATLAALSAITTRTR